MTKREKPPLIQVMLTPKGLRPNTSDDAEKLASSTIGGLYELIPVTKRSPKHLRTYWKALGLVVKATGRWSSTELMHEEIKWCLGYRTRFVDWKTGIEYLRPDSVALDKMDQESFVSFFNAAMKLISEEVGIDPLQFLEE